MKLCVDENLSPVVAQCLHQLSVHRIQHVTEINAKGLEDVELFRHLAALEFDGLITHDHMQLVNTIERDALRESGLVWIGIPPGKLHGLQGFASDVATISLALPEVLDDWPKAPTAIRLSRATSKAIQRELL